MWKSIPLNTLALSLACLPLFTACGDDDSDDTSSQETAGDTGSGAAGSSGAVGDSSSSAGGAGGSSSPLYVRIRVVFDVNWDRTVYYQLSDKLEFDATVDEKTERGFPSVASISAEGDRVLIASGEKPTITEYSIGEDLSSWTEGKTLSFADYPLDDNANFFWQFPVDAHTRILPYNVTSRIIWDPTTLTITKTLEDTKVPLKSSDGRLASGGGNRAGVTFKGPVQQSFAYYDSDYVASPETLVAVYDEQTLEEKSIVTLPCPGVVIPTVDEEGNTYYSAWEVQIAHALFNDGPNPCVARVKSDQTLDTAWTTDFRDITDGRYVTNFRYVANGLAIANVLHHELIKADWNAGYSPDVADQINGEGEHWKIWLFDLNKHTGAPIEGITLPVLPKSSVGIIDGRIFLYAAYENWSRTRIFEITEDQKAVQVLDTAGVVEFDRLR